MNDETMRNNCTVFSDNYRDYKFNEFTFLKYLKFYSWIVLLIFSLLQAIYFFSLHNMMAICFTLSSWMIITKIFFNRIIFYNYTFSVFLIIGYATTQLYFPLIFTFIEGKELVYNLKYPIDVFFHSFSILITITVFHSIYRKCSKYKFLYISRFILNRWKLYSPPSDSQIWLMGIVGLVAMYYVYIFANFQQDDSIIIKFVEGLMPFTYAPFFIIIGRIYGRKGKMDKYILTKLAVFSIFILFGGLGSNIRSAILLGYMSLLFGVFIGMSLNIIKLKIFSLKNFVICIVFYFSFIGPMADLSTAMVMVRAIRSDLSKTELINSTVDAFFDKNALKTFRVTSLKNDSDWDEKYLDNMFINKFCNLKFSDASLEDAYTLGSQNQDMYQYSINRIWAILPDPLMKVLNLNIDKKELNKSSFGDYLFFKSGLGLESSLGGKRTGHLAGTGLAAFGWWYLLILGFGMLPVFAMLDLLKMNNKRTLCDLSNGYKGEFHLSLCGLIALTSIFQFLPKESVISTATFVIRTWGQMVFLYVILHFLTSLFKFRIR